MNTITILFAWFVIAVIACKAISLFIKSELEKDFKFPKPIIRTETGTAVELNIDAAFTLVKWQIESVRIDSDLERAANLLHEFKIKYGQCEMYRELQAMYSGRQAIVIGV